MTDGRSIEMKRIMAWNVGSACCSRFQSAGENRANLVRKMAEGPAGPESIFYSGGALPVAVTDRRRVVDDGGAGAPSKAEMDTVKPVVPAESVSCVELLDRGVSCAMGAAAARASAEPVPPSIGMAKTEAKTVSAEDEIDLRPVQPSVVATEAETRATNLPWE